MKLSAGRVAITLLLACSLCNCYEEGGGGRLLFPDPRRSPMGHHVIDNIADDDQQCGRLAFQQRQQPTTLLSGEIQLSFEIKNAGEVVIGTLDGNQILTKTYSKRGTYSLPITLTSQMEVLTFRFKSKFGGTYWSCADVEVADPKPVRATNGMNTFNTLRAAEYMELLGSDATTRAARVLVSATPVKADEYCGLEIWQHSLSPSLGGTLIHKGGGHYVSGAYVTVSKYTKMFVKVVHKSASGKPSGCSVVTSPVTSKSVVLHETDSGIPSSKAEPLRIGHHANTTHSCLISNMIPDCVDYSKEGVSSHRIDLGDHYLTSPVGKTMSRGVQTLQTEDDDCILLVKDTAHQVTLNSDSSAYRFHYIVEEGYEPSYLQLLWYTSPMTAFHHPDMMSNVTVTVLYTNTTTCPNNTYIADNGYTEYGRWNGISLPYGYQQKKTVTAGRYCVLMQLADPDTNGQNVDIWYRTGPEGLHTGGVGLHPTTGLELLKTNTSHHGEAARLTFHAARSRSPVTYEVFVSKNKALFRMPEQLTDDLESVANISSHVKPWKKKLSIDIPSSALVPSSDGICMFYQILVSARNTDGDHMIYAPYSYYPGACLVPDELEPASSDGNNAGLIVGLLAGVVILAALLIAFKKFYWDKRKSTSSKNIPPPLEETALQPPAFQMDGEDLGASSVVSTDAPTTEPTEAAAAVGVTTSGQPSTLTFSNPTSSASSPTAVKPQVPMIQETPCGATSELAERLRRQREKLEA